ncbi:DUF4328 domain-containing protein [Actinoplanes sp. NPDC049599]|uniref:DUF4328 domain-containing protein n=1 Tax=Actinoplanes sp. NPDC049599 TaxID=3363903 RepID=UPI0037919ADE
MTEFAPYQGGAFQPSPAFAGPARSLRVPARVTLVALGLIGAESLVGAALQAFCYPMAVGAGEPTAAQLAVADFLYLREPAVAAVLVLFAGLSFVVWLHRARTNLDGPDVEELTWKRGWSIGGWFLPLGNLVIPQLVVSEIDRVSERLADEAEGRPHERHPGVAVAWVTLWSLFLVVSQIGESVLGALYPGPSVLLGSAFGVFETVVAGSAILLVRQITANQERARAAADRLGRLPVADPAPAPAPAPAGAPEPERALIRAAAPGSSPRLPAAAEPVSATPVSATEFPDAPEIAPAPLGVPVPFDVPVPAPESSGAPEPVPAPEASSAAEPGSGAR